MLDDQDRQLQFEIETQKERLAARLSKDASGEPSVFPTPTMGNWVWIHAMYS